MTRIQKTTRQAPTPTEFAEKMKSSVKAAAVEVDPNTPVQVDASVFLAARLREVTAEAANLRMLVADLQSELARMKANEAQIEIDRLDQVYKVGNGTVLQKRDDGTFWRTTR